MTESFWTNSSDTGSFLTVKLCSGKGLKEKGWPWVQQCIRGILGGKEKVTKANFQSDGKLLVKTKDAAQTEKLLKARCFGDEECTVEKDKKLNQSRGTIFAYDLLDLTEEEIVGWLAEFGVVEARRFTRKGREGLPERTPTVLLTFDRPSCPDRIELDYVVYKVRRHIPNPLMCHQCGKFGHAQVRCENEAKCLICGESKHSGDCQRKCINCGEMDHDCRSRNCRVWKKEREICEIKATREVSYAHARRMYEKEHQTPLVRSFASVVQTTPENTSQAQENSLRGRVEKMEHKMDKMIMLLDRLLKHKEGDQTERRVMDEEPRVEAIRETSSMLNTETSGESQDMVGLKDDDFLPTPTQQTSELDQSMTGSVPSAMESTPSGQAHSSQGVVIGPSTSSGTRRGRGRPKEKKHKQRPKNIHRGVGEEDESDISPSPLIGNKPHEGLGSGMPSLTRMVSHPT